MRTERLKPNGRVDCIAACGNRPVGVDVGDLKGRPISSRDFVNGLVNVVVGCPTLKSGSSAARGVERRPANAGYFARFVAVAYVDLIVIMLRLLPFTTRPAPCTRVQ